MVGVSWEEAVLYLALTLPKQENRRQELKDLLPRWKKEATATFAPPGITTAEVKLPLQGDKDWSKSLFYPASRAPTGEEQKMIMGHVLEQAIIINMANSCYLFDGSRDRATPGWQLGRTSPGPPPES